MPLVARAQQPAGDIARVGLLSPGLDHPLNAAGYPALLAELQKHGFTEGKNLIVEQRRIDKEQAITFAAAAELIQSKVDVFVATGPEMSLKAAIAASQAIPIVIIAGDYDPVARGYVSSLAHPGGNITGLYYRQPELAPKQLEYFVEAFPDKKPLTVMWDSASADEFNAAKRAAKSMHLELGSYNTASIAD
jgi:putative ABC transport system substrate-binding protein